MFRRLISVILSVIIFWTTSGFSLEHHYCSKKDEHTYTIAGISHSVCDTDTSESSSCCSVMKQNTQSSKRCCTDTKISAKLDAKAISTREKVPQAFNLSIDIPKQPVYFSFKAAQFEIREPYIPPDISLSKLPLFLHIHSLLI
jgi:hypothetical protein